MILNFAQRTTAVLLVALLMSAYAPFAKSQAGAVSAAGTSKITNADVIRLAKDHQPDPQIIRKINDARQSGAADFDLSPSALIALHDAGVSNDVLKAMMGDGRVRPAGNPGPVNPGASTGHKVAAGATNSDVLNPQPLPPNSRVREILSHATLAKGPVIKINGSRPSLEPGVAQSLQQQSVQAKAERAQFAPSTLKPATGVSSASMLQQAQRPLLVSRANTGTYTGPTKIMDGTTGTDPATGGSVPNPPGSNPNGTGTNPPAGSTPSETTPPSGKPLSKAALTHAPAPISACRFNATTPVVETVSGRAHDLYFTPDPGNSTANPTNQYTIRGCNFGAAQGQGNVHLVGAFRNNPSPVHFGIDSWSDTLIVATFNPTFQNEYDLDNITLVVTNANGAGVQLTGNHFVATRKSRPLIRIPNSLVKLPTDTLSVDRFATPVNSQTLQLANMLPTSLKATILFYLFSSLWDSNTGDGYPQQRLSFSDHVDFSKLHPGFAVDDQIQTLTVPMQSTDSCKFSDTVVGASMQGSSLGVGVQPAECDFYGKYVVAYYGLEISVTGPAGDLLDPWQSGLN